MRRAPPPDDEIIAGIQKLWSNPRAVEALRSYTTDRHLEYETYLAEHLAENAEAWDEYRRFMDDPDTFLDESADKHLEPAEPG